MQEIKTANFKQLNKSKKNTIILNNIFKYFANVHKFK